MVDLRLPRQRKFVFNAPVWKRILSFLIDLAIVQIVIFSPLTSVIQSKLPTSSDYMENYNFILKNPDTLTSLYPLLGAVFLMIFLYFVIFEYKTRQTPGKMVFKLYLFGQDKKEKISLWKIILRNIAVFPIFPFSLFWIIDPIYLIFTGKRLSDIISKTQIVEELE